MIYGLGTDLLNIHRIEQTLQRHPRLAQRILTVPELEAFYRSNTPGRWLAKRFAAKEASAKALGTGFRQGLSWQHIEVDHDPLGKPELKFSGAVQKRLHRLGIRSWLSISDEQDYVLATVVLEIV